MQIAELRRVNAGDTVGDRDNRTVGERQGRAIGNTGNLHTQCLGTIRIGERGSNRQIDRCVFNRVRICDRQVRRIGDRVHLHGQGFLVGKDVAAIAGLCNKCKIDVVVGVLRRQDPNVRILQERSGNIGAAVLDVDLHELTAGICGKDARAIRNIVDRQR